MSADKFKNLDLFNELIKFLVLAVLSWVGLKISQNSQELRRLSEKDAQDQVNIQLLLKNSDDVDRAVQLIKDTLATKTDLEKVDERINKLWDQFIEIKQKCYQVCQRNSSSIESYRIRSISYCDEQWQKQISGFVYNTHALKIRPFDHL